MSIQFKMNECDEYYSFRLKYVVYNNRFLAQYLPGGHSERFEDICSLKCRGFVYAFFKRGKALYVGRTRDVKSRFLQHAMLRIPERPDKVLLFPLSLGKERSSVHMHRNEQEAMDFFKPKYNIRRAAMDPNRRY